MNFPVNKFEFDELHSQTGGSSSGPITKSETNAIYYVN